MKPKIYPHPFHKPCDVPLALMADLGGHWQEEDGRMSPVKVSQFRNLKQTGQLKTHKNGGTVMIPADELARLHKWQTLKINCKQLGSRRLVFA